MTLFDVTNVNTGGAMTLLFPLALLVVILGLAWRYRDRL